ncbi:hypothetical protein PHMEG_0006414 [Phytophthora megakarya]|uniref:Myb/SANT-like domain-containing protein n=1 Tax=Phytophthora megakarya TaxID=4795 RepID=A0A225WQI6_9STRA|nr:hypothetical protein PHMEG_0006414 [Phytophthora megakarya]
MVLFLEAETLRLLDLYAELHADASNVTPSGVLLHQRAREMLTASLNKSFPREQPWSESQVSVKFKNLRSDYAEYKWLSSQSGFQADGVDMGEDWWQTVKRIRPKCNAFKGKLPWIFEARMRQIVGDGGPPYYCQRPLKKQKREVRREEQEDRVGTVTSKETAKEGTVEVTAAPPSDMCDDVVEREEAVSHQEQGHSALIARDGTGDFSYSRSLARSVEQSSVAAAGMARGFQDLIAVFQEQTAQCRVLEQHLTQRSTETPSVVLAEQRSVLLVIARSLEQSTRATADMAQGYRDLMKAFVHDSEARQQREN